MHIIKTVAHTQDYTVFLTDIMTHELVEYIQDLVCLYEGGGGLGGGGGGIWGGRGGGGWGGGSQIFVIYGGTLAMRVRSVWREGGGEFGNIEVESIKMM
ncbi:unnamed protein product [Dicrocoelium dendriticum]|nr:unnamed protein product [Dicrocoelium dendriticum]